jgi:hypothetical protein
LENGFNPTRLGMLPPIKMTALFTPQQMCDLSEHRAKIRDEKFAEKMKPVVTAAVDFYARKIRPESVRILEDLKESNWAPACQFYSYDFRDVPGNGHNLREWMRLKTDGEYEYMECSHYDRLTTACPLGTVFSNGRNTCSMWTIYARTDFRKRLVAELGLDPEQFDIKNIANFVPKEKLLFKDDRIIEYTNQMYIFYKEKRKSTLNPLSDVWKSRFNTSVTY